MQHTKRLTACDRIVRYLRSGEEEVTKERAELDKLVTRVTFSDADDKGFLDTAYEIEWSTLAKRVTPEMLVQPRKVTGN